ncbi:trypsin-like [Photinus pyralis]|uniref:Peptidase S1 domain-containing protein n=1 Tax=Photinus pyralis TaxID=7054 RepID=A0A1Y1MUV7_PHOPY|nr:trypsin-like [Photinus pyralis]
MECLQALVFSIILALVNASNSTEPKISNGYTASRGQFPYLASYQYRGEHFCGCSILNAEWLLTAAHCVDQALNLPREDLQIVAGILKLYDSPPYRQTRQILRQYKHPNYNGGISPNDIGLIRVKTPFNWSNDVNWIALPYENREYEGLAVIAGWGYLRSSYPAPSVHLQYARGGTIRENECNSIVNQYGVAVDIRSICTIGYDAGNETSCKGDSGGPLVYPDYPNRPVQIGVMSWNLSPCGLNRSPSVSTKVSRYIGWIVCRVQNDNVSPSAPCY